MTANTGMDKLASPAELRAQLIRAGLLIESGVDGVYGHGEPFDRVRDALTAWLTTLADEEGALQLRFPPLIPKRRIEELHYLHNFPHLAGSVFSFEGTDAAAIEMAEIADRHGDWSSHQSQTEAMLPPAACHPVYPALAPRGPIDPAGITVDVGPSWVFRHEPSVDPARRQIFHMHELVRVGSPEATADWRTRWTERGVTLFTELGLSPELAPANDPFFGRRGRLLAANQLSQALKLEVLVSITAPDPTACASINYHREHFAEIFGLELPDGRPAHSSCFALGQERIVLALFARHGLDPDGWPERVRAVLWP